MQEQLERLERERINRISDEEFAKIERGEYVEALQAMDQQKHTTDEKKAVNTITMHIEDANWQKLLETIPSTSVIVQHDNQKAAVVMDYDQWREKMKRLAMLETIMEAMESREKTRRNPSSLTSLEELCEKHNLPRKLQTTSTTILA